MQVVRETGADRRHIRRILKKIAAVDFCPMPQRLGVG